MQYRHQIMQATLCLLTFFVLQVSSVQALPVDSPRSYSTYNSIGIEWDVAQDENHNATCTVGYRRVGDVNWKDGLPLFRVDFNGANMMAGSLFFLEPGTEFEVLLTFSDPDNGNETLILQIATRPLPVKPTGGRRLHVVPGSGGGRGTAADPFHGIEAAQVVAKPGDIFLLHSGMYPGETELSKSGTADKYIVWQAAPGEEPVFETLRIAADFTWLEGLLVTGNEYGLRTYSAPRGVVVTKNRFTECHYCVYLNHGGSNWYIADNTIVGDVEPASGDYGGEGIELNHSSGHVVAHNSISKVADGVSYPGQNCDIFGNEIFDVSDDGIEPDYGYANNRIWGNRISGAYHNGISFQPMNSAPWYILFNQVAAPVESGIKLRGNVDRALIAHNTFVGWQGAQKTGSSRLLSFHSYNNLWISVTDWYAWENGDGGVADWRTKLDYDGFDWGNYTYGFKWGDRYHDLAEFSAATGLQTHGVRVNKDTCFTKFTVPAPPPASVPFQHLTLRQGCNAVNAGLPLANINDHFLGTAPDLGAYEYGKALPHYGPRVNSISYSDLGSSGSGTSGSVSVAPVLLPLLLGR